MSSRNRNTILFFLIVIAVLALFLHQAGVLQPIEDLVLEIVQPIFGGALGVGEGARDVTTGLTDVNNLRNKVAELQAQLNELNASRIRITELESENTLLRQQLGYKQSNPDF